MLKLDCINAIVNNLAVSALDWSRSAKKQLLDMMADLKKYFSDVAPFDGHTLPYNRKQGNHETADELAQRGLKMGCLYITRKDLMEMQRNREFLKK